LSPKISHRITLKLSVHESWGSSHIFGEAGRDRLYGMLGNDLLDGGTGNDRLYGSEADDTLIGGIGFDRIIDEITGGLIDVG